MHQLQRSWVRSASVGTVESEGRQTKHWRILYETKKSPEKIYKEKKELVPRVHGQTLAATKSEEMLGKGKGVGRHIGRGTLWLGVGVGFN